MNKLSSNLLIAYVCLCIASCSKKGEPTQPMSPRVEQSNPSNPTQPQKPSNPSEPTPSDPNPNANPRKLSDYEMGSRAYAQWKSESNEDLYKKFDLETLWLDGKKDKYTATYLSEFISFHSSTTDGSVLHVFTAEDLAKTEIVDLNYNEGAEEVSFKIKFGSVVSNVASKLKLYRHLYYQNKIGPNREVIASKYVSGVEKYAGVLLGSLISYDTDRYAIQVQERSSALADYSGNKISIPVLVGLKKGDKELASFALELEGFRPFNELKKDLKIEANLYELNQVAKELYAKYKDKNEQLATTLNARVQNKKDLFKYEVRGKEMSWEGSNLVCSDSNLDYLDLYFPQLRIKVESAKFRVEESKRIFLYMKLKIEAIKDTSLEAVTYDISTFVQNEK